MKLNSGQGITLLISAIITVSLIVSVRYTLRQQRRTVREDLERRGLVPPHKHHHRRRHHHEDASQENQQNQEDRELKRNPTLAERGGLPPIRTESSRQSNAK